MLEAARDSGVAEIGAPIGAGVGDRGACACADEHERGKRPQR